MKIGMQLQQYSDGTLGYLGIDGNDYAKNNSDAIVLFTQGEDEDRDEFIAKHNIEINAGCYGSDEKLDRLFNSTDDEDRLFLVQCYYCLDRLITDASIRVRVELASIGYGLDILIKDPDSIVREEVARYGYGLETLINDEAPHVRGMVARQKYGLDRLINDENARVRAEVARQGYGLSTLINDKDPVVRVAVASQGYNLQTLLKDENNCVRVEVAKHGYGLELLAKDTDDSVRRTVAEHGESLKLLVEDNSRMVREAVYEYLANCDWNDKDILDILEISIDRLICEDHNARWSISEHNSNEDILNTYRSKNVKQILKACAITDLAMETHALIALAVNKYQLHYIYRNASTGLKSLIEKI